MSTADMPSPAQRNSARRTLLLIFLVSAAPILAAYVAFFGWKPSAGVNYGELVQPPVQLEWAQRDRHWRLAWIGGSRCEKACRDALYAGRQSRLAQAKHAGRIERLWVVTDDGRADMASLGNLADELQVVRASVPTEYVGRLVLIDPLGNLMMRYPESPDAKRMIGDLRQLLKYSRAG